MRDQRMAAEYRDWRRHMTQRVAGIADDLVASYGLRMRIPAEEFAQVMLEMWEATSVNAVIDGLDDAATSRLMSARTQMLAAAVVEGFSD
jgi:hypothetical protein